MRRSPGATCAKVSCAKALRLVGNSMGPQTGPRSFVGTTGSPRGGDVDPAGATARNRSSAASLLPDPASRFESRPFSYSVGKAAEATNRFRRVLAACAQRGSLSDHFGRGFVHFRASSRWPSRVAAFSDAYDCPMSIGSRQVCRGPGKIVWRRPSESRLCSALSPRETDILTLIAGGLSNKEIARSLDIGPETVKSHLKSVFTKLGVERRAQAVSRAQTLGLVTTQ